MHACALRPTPPPPITRLASCATLRPACAAPTAPAASAAGASAPPSAAPTRRLMQWATVRAPSTRGAPAALSHAVLAWKERRPTARRARALATAPKAKASGRPRRAVASARPGRSTANRRACAARATCVRARQAPSARAGCALGSCAWTSARSAHRPTQQACVGACPTALAREALPPTPSAAHPAVAAATRRWLGRPLARALSPAARRGCSRPIRVRAPSVSSPLPMEKRVSPPTAGPAPLDQRARRASAALRARASRKANARMPPASSATACASAQRGCTVLAACRPAMNVAEGRAAWVSATRFAAATQARACLGPR